MDIDRILIRKKIRELAKIDYNALKKKTSFIDISEVEFSKNKIEDIDRYFNMGLSGSLFRIDVLKGKRLFLRTFIEDDLDYQFNFTINFKNGKLEIIIEKDSMNDNNLNNLIKSMYLHTLL